MSETTSEADRRGDPVAEVLVEEFEPEAAADPEEPETLADEEPVPGDAIEANPVDVVEQREVVDVDDGDYDRPD